MNNKKISSSSLLCVAFLIFFNVFNPPAKGDGIARYRPIEPSFDKNKAKNQGPPLNQTFIINNNQTLIIDSYNNNDLPKNIQSTDDKENPRSSSSDVTKQESQRSKTSKSAVSIKLILTIEVILFTFILFNPNRDFKNIRSIIVKILIILLDKINR
ncbi:MULTISPECIES: hypothetical protein [Trichocoleus]|uniref:Fam-c protein n=1 Tax=Trichocoleus desertorum GB2-A4 TaxID=2933944 RepID=A0ABV0J7Y0_9CYAN|nr:hypothetical protein [Trichocoleus sp. FACHB-46]MBD1862239.1 hypothetical protein [Trichocoleus sp. FACHB-46]